MHVAAFDAANACTMILPILRSCPSSGPASGP